MTALLNWKNKNQEENFMADLRSDLNFDDIDFENMTEEELKEFRSQFNPDEMGDVEVEGVDE